MSQYIVMENNLAHHIRGGDGEPVLFLIYSPPGLKGPLACAVIILDDPHDPVGHRGRLIPHIGGIIPGLQRRGVNLPGHHQRPLWAVVLH